MINEPTIREVYILLQKLEKQFDNHLKHHFAITLVCIAAALAGMFNIGIALIILLYR